MNYQLLLKKYISHVGEIEGTTFLGDFYSPTKRSELTPEEWDELQVIDSEVYAEEVT